MKLYAPVASLLLLVWLSIAARPALAQTIYTPVDLTPASFTADVIANGAATALASTSTGFDTGGTDIAYCLMATDFVSPTRGAATRGLPVSRVLQSAQAATPGLTFQLQPYSGNNSLRISGTGTGTMTLATPQSTRSIWLCAATGNGSGTNPTTATVQFTDGTTQVFNLTISDWFYGANYVANNLGRVGRPNDQFDNTANEPRIYQFELALLATNYNKVVSSILFAKTQPSGVATATVFNGLAITLATTCGLPTATATAASTSLCPGQSTLLTTTLVGGSGPFTGQWQSSPDGITWTDIASATGLTYTATPAATTRYRYRTVCSTTATAVSNVLTVAVVIPSATLAYSNATYCRTGTSPAPTVTPAGGTFSSAPAGLVLNATTGVINLAGSVAGTYTVSYLSGGQCPATATFSVTVLAPNVVLTYPTTTFCRVGTSGTPIATPAGGTFSSASAGLAINTVTGVIDLSSSTAGTYTVSYTSAGMCPTTATTTLLVKSDALPLFPNIVTPNGDKSNDLLKLNFAYPTDVTGFKMVVYNRWGRQMYEGTSSTDGWNPDQASGGVYYYMVDYTDCAGRPQHYKGWVEVVK